MLACNYRGSFAGVTLTWRRAPASYSYSSEFSSSSSAHSLGLQGEGQKQSGQRAATEGGGGGGEWGGAPSGGRPSRLSAQQVGPAGEENPAQSPIAHGGESEASTRGASVLPGAAAVGPLAWPAFYMRQGAHAQVFGADFKSRVQVHSDQYSICILVHYTSTVGIQNYE